MIAEAKANSLSNRSSAHLPSLRWLELLLADDRPVSERLAVKPPLESVRGRAASSLRQARRRLVAAK